MHISLTPSQFPALRLLAASLALIVGGAGTLPAQSYVYSERARTTEFAGGGTATRLELARLHADGHRDALALIGSALHIAFDPMDQSSTAVLATGVFDFAVLDDPQNPGRDIVMTVEPTGLWPWTPAGGVLARGSAPVADGWANARKLRRARWASGAPEGVIAVDVATGQVLGAEYVANTWQVRAPLAGPAWQAATVQRIGEQLDVAILGPAGLTLTSTDGAVVRMQLPGAATTDLLRVAPVTQGRGGRLFWVLSVGSEQYLAEVDASGLYAVAPLSVTDVRDVLITRYGTDVWPDLLLCTPTDALVLQDLTGDTPTTQAHYGLPPAGVAYFVLTEQPGPVPFGPTGSQQVDGADLDGDGDTDLVIGGMGLRTLSGTVRREMDKEGSTYVDLGYEHTETVVGDRVNAFIQGVMVLPDLPRRVPSNATHVRVEAWRMEHYPGAWVAVSDELVEIELGASTVPFSCNLDMPIDLSTSIVAFKLTLVVDSQGPVFPNAPSSTTLFTWPMEMRTLVRSWRRAYPWGPVPIAPDPDDGSGYSPVQNRPPP